MVVAEAGTMMSSPPSEASDFPEVVSSPSPKRKRSRDEEVETGELDNSSHTLMGDEDLTAAQDGHIEVGTKELPAKAFVPPPALPGTYTTAKEDIRSPSVNQMMPPPSSTASLSSTTPPRSGQHQAGPTVKAAQPEEESPASAITSKHAAIRRSTDTDEIDADETLSTSSPPHGIPDEDIEEFGWKDLHERYHYKMQEMDASEAEILNKFAGLTQVSLAVRALCR